MNAQQSPSASPVIFDRATLRRRIARARPGIAAHDALLRECGDQITDRLGDVRRSFDRALDLSPFSFLATGSEIVTADKVVFDEERLPFAPASFDLIVSNMAMHWVNDVPGMLAQIHGILKPGGLFIATLAGENTLHELRGCLMEAELSVSGGISPRLSPTIDLLTASGLLQRAGFALPVADVERVTLLYPDVFALMRDLRGMGQANLHVQRLRHPTRRAVLMEMARLYAERHATADGLIPASFDIVHLHGWKAL
jgi:NADH dehydrogenase [ubiquinone] 1 alpha subcomplex assembly factor 5